MLIRTALTGLAAAALVAAGILPAAVATDYERGFFRCGDFEDTAGLYKTTPTESGYAVSYARCLLARGDGDDVRALNMLEVEAKNGHVSAAYLLALDIATNGAENGKKWDRNSYKEAFHAFDRVMHLINLQQDSYPKGMAHPEHRNQYELHAYYYLVLFAYRQFTNGLDTSHKSHLIRSPTYTGNKEDLKLKLYPQYSSYTQHNLKSTIENAEICAKLPMKDHFEKLLYLQTVSYCNLMKNYIQKIRPLEKERLALLEDESCARDIEVCSEYQEVVHDRMAPLVRERIKETEKIWNMTLDSFAAAKATTK